MNRNRLEEWVDASWAIGGHEQKKTFMSVAIQGLGRLDCELSAFDQEFLTLDEDKKASIAVGLEFSKHLTLSYLWVLGGYEILRTIDQLYKMEHPRTQTSIGERITSTKHQFERLRIPLAKFEPSRKNPSDSPVAFPGMSPEFGIGWGIAHNEFITRQSLSNALLLLLLELHSIS